MKKFWSILPILVFFPTLASAHAFGQKYTLPLPIWLYVYGGGTTIIVSFLLIGYFFTEADPKSLEAKIVITRPAFFPALKFLGLFLFILTLIAGIFGSQRPAENFAPTFFWITFLLGLTYLVALAGNIWHILNPWKTIASGIGDYKLFQYPAKLGYWPALLFYFFLIWLELLSGGAGVRPERLAMYLVWYTGITLGGSILFGIADWFRYGELFSVFFRLISKLAPLAYKDGKLILRWPFVGLLEGRAERMSLLFFIIFMLSSTAFDGFRETTKAYKIIAGLSFIKDYQNKELVMMFGVFLLFLFLYLLAIGLMKLLTQSPYSVKELSLAFAYSLIPIVLAYNLAHYFTLLLVQGQQIISSLSDPLNMGWNLFGTGNYVINVGIIGAKTVWQSQVAFILIGHIAAVYIAHIVALRTFTSHRQAVLSQLPMLVVMVCYTMAGLWILSQPLTLG